MPVDMPIALACQLLVEAGHVMTSDLRAVDAVTGETLLFIPKGQAASGNQCVNAPDKHALIVTDAWHDKTIIPGSPP